MAKKKQQDKEEKKVNLDGVVGLVGSTTEQAVSETLEVNYMPYAMSVIVSRAIPEIDGFNPPTESFCTPCTRWACSPAAGPNPPTS